MDSIDSGDDEKNHHSRRDEISMFASLASGGSIAFGSDDTKGRRNRADGETSEKTVRETVGGPAETTVVTETETPIPTATSIENDRFALMIQQQQESSGTFAMTSTASTANVSTNSNLEAAAAALAGEINTVTASTSIPAAFQIPTSQPHSHQQHVRSIPMHSEVIHLPRTLFFGPILPPRILNEARTVVRQEMEQMGHPTNSPPPLVSQFSPAVRNLINAIHTFGFGISLFDHSDDFQGDPHVSTIQPVWGDTIRAERDTQRKRKKINLDQEKRSKDVPDHQNIHTWTEKPFCPNTTGDVGNNKLLFSQLARSSSESSFEPPALPADPNKSIHPLDNYEGQNSLTTQHHTTYPNHDVGSLSNTDSVTASSYLRGKSRPPKMSRSLSDSSRDTENTEVEKAQVARTANSSDINHILLDDRTAFTQLVRGSSDASVKSTDSPVGASTPLSGIITDKAIFSQFARGEVTNDESPIHTKSNTIRSSSSPDSLPTTPTQFGHSLVRGTSSDSLNNSNTPEQALFSKWALGDVSEEQTQFAQWARGEAPAEGSVIMRKSPPHQTSGTFRNVSQTQTDDSDDGSVVGSELKMKVGISEHLNAALASFATDTQSGSPHHGGGNESLSVEESQNLLSQLGLTTPGGRPLTNLELTNGCVPIFACDDPALPLESDLGLYDTKEEQMRAIEQRQSQEIVEKHTMPNVFGSISCPNPALDPDDTHSWNSRTVPARKSRNNPSTQSVSATPSTTNGPGLLPVPESPSSPGSRMMNGMQQPSLSSSNLQSLPNTPDSSNVSSGPPLFRKANSTQVPSRATNGGSRSKETNVARLHRAGKAVGLSNMPQRFGWWNAEEETEDFRTLGDLVKEKNGFPLQKPPEIHSANNLFVVTGLEPSPTKLRHENQPLSKLHPATSTASHLPFLSDRPPSWRYLQVDAKAIGFPPLSGEIEPLFCSLSIYHVEASSQHNRRTAMSSSPQPNSQKCGRVTEILNFDVVTNQRVEERCSGALWPYWDSSGVPPEAERTQSTRCGVFPIPSNLNFANLYVVLVIQKVMSDQSGTDIYCKLSDKGEGVDVEKMRAKAEKASDRQGRFLHPFAFGVAPLLQVFGPDLPTVTSSRAVQIPLFQLKPGLGDRPIIDHIMVMLYPRAKNLHLSTGGPAVLTNGGTAMLVMRNFGYLGLHQVLHKRSSLARNRLVNFSGELQLRRKNNGDVPLKTFKKNFREHVVPSRHVNYQAEPSRLLGRNVVSYKRGDQSQLESNFKNSAEEEVGDSRSPIYAQELAPVPLQLSTKSSRSLYNSRLKNSRGPTSSSGPEPYFYTTFCNELLCSPRVLHHAPKGNLTVKIEVCKIKWDESNNVFVAQTPHFGPSIHNQRRGPPMVPDAYTSCIFSAGSVPFLNEFKIKLPLLLCSNDRSSLSILFSVYCIETKQKRSWTDKFASKLSGFSKRSQKRGGGTEGVAREELTAADENEEAKVELLGCGFIPLTSDPDSQCLIDDGVHNVKLCYEAGPVDANGELKLSESVVLSKASSHPKASIERSSSKVEASGSVATGSGGGHEDESLGGSQGEKLIVDTDEVNSMLENNSLHTEIHGENTTVVSGSGSYSLSETEQSSAGLASKYSDDTRHMSLQVQIVVHSSLHPQNAALREFMCRQPDKPQPLQMSALPPSAPWLQPRQEFLKLVDTCCNEGKLSKLDREQQLLVFATIDVSKSSVCPTSMISRFLLRLINNLTTSIVSGSGEPSLAWSNPAAALPLRTHAFASLLQLLSSFSNFFSRNGSTNLDGRGKWNASLVSRFLPLILDEEQLLSEHQRHLTEEPADIVSWLSHNEGRNSPTKLDSKIVKPKMGRSQSEGRPRHVRSDSDNLIFSSEIGESNALAISPSFLALDLEGSSFSFSESLGESSLQDRSMTMPAGSFEAAISSLKDSSPKVESRGHTENSDAKWTQKIDSRADFESNLLTASSDFLIEDSFSSLAGSSRAGGRRKWMTLPSSALAPIREDLDTDNPEEGILQTDLFPTSDGRGSDESISKDMIKKGKKQSVKQMRIPTRKKVSSIYTTQFEEPSTVSAEGRKVITTDEEIESAGTAFLDVIGENLGYSSSKKVTGSGEEMRVGQAHHRKTRSRCSIDWTLPEDEILFRAENDPRASHPLSGDSFSSLSKGWDEKSKKTEFDLSMTMLQDEFETCHQLSTYAERINLMGKLKVAGRWFPYLYEVIIFQWVALLLEQRRSGEKDFKLPQDVSTARDYNHGVMHNESCVKDAASRARGVAISCAPSLFEIIKKSLGWRIHKLLKQADTTQQINHERPFLVQVDDAVMSQLETLISLVTDACIDSRNFDSWEFRQTSIDVNDSIIRFLRDLFAFLHPESVHRLVLVYFARFVVREGKHWQDRDSKIGLRCSWEICKLRLNAVTALVRFPDFVRVNSPQMASWGQVPDDSRPFFDSAVETFLSLDTSGFAPSDGPITKAQLRIPGMQPHWLAELVVDVSLAGTGHADPYIQHRAASLLHELFWSHSQEGRVNGSSSVIGSMHISFLLKILSHSGYLSILGAKTQLRKDLMPCVIYVLQGAPMGMLHSCWRKLCKAAAGKGLGEKFGVRDEHTARNLTAPSNSASFEEVQTPTIFDVFNLLNLALATFEYDGCEDSREIEEREEDYESSVWMKEYLPAIKQKGLEALFRRSPLARRFQIEESKDEDEPPAYSSTSSRRWQCHDGSSVVINTCRYIVREVLKMSKPSNVELNGNPNSRDGSVPSNASATIEKSTLAELDFSHSDIVAFVRAAASVYLHSLSLRQSDIICIKTLTAAIELVKIFGIKLFLEAVGETLQHWMRCILTHCGARRAEVRVQALEFLALVLRVTWDSYGSFFRIRVPLLAVQTEVMERIVATAATRYYREQRRISSTVDYLTNDSAEATLSMMWRTLDRLHHQSASQNVAFRSALIRLAQKMKKLYRAYIAAHALAILKRARSPLSPNSNTIKVEDESPEVSAMKQSRRISVHRIILSSAGYSKQFLGLQRPNPQRAAVAHNEAVEDAFLEAADVFSPTELPSHRVAWLQKLAEFHASRLKYAEEATCHFRIYATLRQASRVHECIWSSMPFLPWTSDGGVHIDGEGPAGEPDEYYDSDYYLDDLIEDHGLESHYGRQIEKTNSFRRIFYRVANSVRMRTGDWEMGGNRHLFYGVTLVSEYGPSPPWTTLREMEAAMIEEAEAAGELYMKAGITESSRVSWGLATNYYAERHNYSKLCYAYQRLASVMTSHVPVVDTNDMALDFSHPLGRFYRVWFHGGAPEDLIGKEFVYRSPKHIKLDEFGTKLSEMIKSILPDNSPIDLVLDDGRPEDASKWRSNQRRARGVAPLEPVKIKVTPLRPLLKRANRTRGTPEWFHLYTDVAFTNGSSGEKYSSGRYARSNFGGERNSSQYRSRGQSSSSTASVFAFGETSSSRFSNGATGTKCHGSRGSTCSFASNDSELVGVDKFSFLQPIKKDRGRASRDWLKASGDFSEKSLRVTQLQVESSFPACVARQAVLNRTVFTQSPLEAGIDAVCSWCSVLFRTAVATNGMMVLGTRTDHGIGNAAARVVADCIHSSRVKEMGITLLKKNGYVAEESDHYGTMMLDYSKLSEDEVNRLQSKLARGIVVFIEILHLLIARNRNLLLTVVEARKQGENTSVGASRNPSRDYGGVGSPHGERRGQVRSPAWSSIPSHKREISGLSTFSGVSSNVRSVSASGPMGTDTQFSPQYDLSRHNVPYSQSSTIGSVNDRTDSAIAVQSELQRGFISMAKVLHPLISAILQHETPKFLKLCTQDTYFSSNSYRQSKMPMADELCFIAAEDLYSQQGSENGSSAPFSGTYSLVSSAEPGLIGLMHPTPSPVGSMAEGSVASRDARTLNRKKNSESSARMYQC